MNDKTVKMLFSLFLIALYTAAMAILLFFVYQVNELNTGTTAVVFQGIKTLIIIGIDLLAICVKKIHNAHKASIISVTVIYSVIVDLFNIFAYAKLSEPKFLLTHMIIVFIYSLFSLPMVYKGICNKAN